MGERWASDGFCCSGLKNVIVALRKGR